MENNKKKSIIPTIILTILSLLWIYPIILILLNSLKKESAITTTGVFELPLGMALRTLLPVLHRWISLHLSGTAL